MAESASEQIDLIIDDMDWDSPVSGVKVGGGSERITVRIAGTIHRQIEEVIALRARGYKTVSDFARKAIDSHLIRILRLNPKIRGILYHWACQKEIWVDDQRQKEFAILNQEWRLWVGQLINEGHAERAAQIVQKRWDMVGQMPEGYWQEKAYRVLETDYPALLGDLIGDRVKGPKAKGPGEAAKIIRVSMRPEEMMEGEEE